MPILTKRKKTEKKSKKISRTNQSILKTIQLNKIRLIFGISEKGSTHALEVAAIRPESSEEVKEFLAATLNALIKMNKFIEEQKSIATKELLIRLNKEKTLVDKAIDLLKPAIKPEERLELKAFNNIIYELQKLIPKNKKYIDKL